MAEIWRFLNELDVPHDGASNMARDEAVLQAVARGDVPPTLRFYRWQQPTLSLGYGQSADDVDSTRAAQFGVAIVRRLTGGRAVLHIPNELTYSIALPEDHPLATGSVVESYRRISAALKAGLQSLAPHSALAADQRAEPAERISQPNAVCFEVPSHYEITANGKKLVGSAQVRKFGGVLQHGAIPLGGDVGDICDALIYADESAREAAKARVRQRATTLAEVSGFDYPHSTVGTALLKAFCDLLGDATLEEGSLSAAETAEEAALRANKYATLEWIMLRQLTY
ncbi:MAG: lipoate--protein ligase family protein [Anaerolineae bacterium]